MGRRVYFDTDLLCHSLISGMGVYETSGAPERLPVGTAEDSALGVPLRNIFSGEFFFVKRLSLRGTMPETHRIRIQNPPDRSLILWPSDMILLAEDSPAQTDFRAANVYDELRLPPPEGSADYGLLFPYRDYPPAEPLDYLLSRVERSGGHGWQNAPDDGGSNGMLNQQYSPSRAFAGDADVRSSSRARCRSGLPLRTTPSACGCRQGTSRRGAALT